jgi:hypothetical protein
VTTREQLRRILERVAVGEPAAEGELAHLLDVGLAADGPAELARRLASEMVRSEGSRDHVSVVTTGLGWLGGGAGAIERALTRLIDTASHDLVLAVYAMSPGSARVWDALERAIDGGITCTLVIDRLDSQDSAMRDRLRVLRERHLTTFHVFDFIGETSRDHLHAKALVADRRLAVVGSANLTAHGMLLAHELALLIDGPAAEEIAARIDMLGRSRLVRPM